MLTRCDVILVYKTRDIICPTVTLHHHHESLTVRARVEHEVVTLVLASPSQRQMTQDCPYYYYYLLIKAQDRL
jgi:hypothetical protein